MEGIDIGEDCWLTIVCFLDEIRDCLSLRITCKNILEWIPFEVMWKRWKEQVYLKEFPIPKSLKEWIPNIQYYYRLKEATPSTKLVTKRGFLRKYHFSTENINIVKRIMYIRPGFFRYLDFYSKNDFKPIRIIPWKLGIQKMFVTKYHVFLYKYNEATFRVIQEDGKEDTVSIKENFPKDHFKYIYPISSDWESSNPECYLFTEDRIIFRKLNGWDIYSLKSITKDKFEIVVDELGLFSDLKIYYADDDVLLGNRANGRELHVITYEGKLLSKTNSFDLEMDKGNELWLETKEIILKTIRFKDRLIIITCCFYSLLIYEFDFNQTKFTRRKELKISTELIEHKKQDRELYSIIGNHLFSFNRQGWLFSFDFYSWEEKNRLEIKWSGNFYDFESGFIVGNTYFSFDK